MSSPQTLRGQATVHSLLGTMQFAAVLTNGAAEVQSAPFTHKADVQERVDANEMVRGFKARNERWEVTVTFFATTADFPTSNAYADALKGAILPRMMSVVTLSGFEEAVRTGNALTEGAPSINGDYVYKGDGTFEPSADWLKVTLPLVKFSHQTAANLTKAVT